MRLRNEPVHEKTYNMSFQLGPIKTRLYSHRFLNKARTLELCIYVEKESYYPRSENKGDDQLCSY